MTIVAGTKHDKYAPFWAAGLILLLITGLLTIWLDFGPFWKGYVLDMTGPTWTYILFRGRFTSRIENRWTRFFSPPRTMLILVAISFLIEGIQYFEFYESTFDRYDFIAYISLLIPVYILDHSTSDS
jgi:hypothetical protein